MPDVDTVYGKGVFVLGRLNGFVAFQVASFGSLALVFAFVAAERGIDLSPIAVLLR